MEIQRYSSTAIIIHWVMAIMIIAMICMGIYMADLPKGSDERSWFFSLHKSIGLTLALLAISRLAWRMISPPPMLPSIVSITHQKMAKATHHLLYLMMFIQPVTGYISSSFSGYKTKFWGVPLPHWGWKNPELNELFTEMHEISAICLVILIVLHIGGVAYHLHRKETEIFKRMWF
jgi:cytochrome b561